MQNNTFSSALVRFGAGAGIFFVWTMLETQVIEPFGFCEHVPFYRANGLCVCDTLAIAMIFAAFVLSETRTNTVTI